MKITMYELLGMVKDGKAPKKIKYINSIWEYDKETKDYFHDGLWLIRSMNSIGLTEREVEILEEKKKIPEKLPLIANTEVNYPDDEFLQRILNLFYELNNKNRLKINEIIDYLDYLKSKGDE